MGERRTRILTYSNVIATLALFVALGGGAYALSLGKGDVKSKHIAKNAVRSKHVKNGGLVLADIKGGSGLLGSRGYAHIDGDGWNEAESKGVIATGHPPETLPGYERYWCFNLAFEPENAVATLGFGSAASAVAIIEHPPTYCPPGLDDAAVHTYTNAGTFYVAFN